MPDIMARSIRAGSWTFLRVASAQGGSSGNSCGRASCRSSFLVQPALDLIQSFQNRNNQHGHERISQAGFCLGLGQPAVLDEEGKRLLPSDLVHCISPDACAPGTLWNGAHLPGPMTSARSSTP